MQVKKLIFGTLLIILSFVYGYTQDSRASMLAKLNLHLPDTSSLKSFFKSDTFSLSSSDKDNTAAPETTKNAAQKQNAPSQNRPNIPPVGLDSLAGKANSRLDEKRNLYFERLSQQTNELKEQNPSEDEMLDDVEKGDDVSNQDEGEVEELSPELADPYAQFRRPAGSENQAQPIITDSPDEDTGVVEEEPVEDDSSADDSNVEDEEPVDDAGL